jgi:hypothetical protein
MAKPASAFAERRAGECMAAYPSIIISEDAGGLAFPLRRRH